MNIGIYALHPFLPLKHVELDPHSTLWPDLHPSTAHLPRSLFCAHPSLFVRILCEGTLSWREMFCSLRLRNTCPDQPDSIHIRVYAQLNPVSPLQIPKRQSAKGHERCANVLNPLTRDG